MMPHFYKAAKKWGFCTLLLFCVVEKASGIDLWALRILFFYFLLVPLSALSAPHENKAVISGVWFEPS